MKQVFRNGPDNNTQSESRAKIALDLLRFFCVLCIVPLHCRYSHRVPMPLCGLVEKSERLLSFFPSLQILLLLSGYLFFTGMSGTFSFSVWTAKLRRRISSLFVPFLLWSFASFVWQNVFQTLPEGMSPWRLFDVLRWIVGWNGWSSHPGGFGLWYIKTLLIASLLAPFYWVVYRSLGTAAVLVGVFLVLHPPLPIDYPLFSAWFFLGGSLSFNAFKLEKATSQMDGLLPCSIAGFVALSVLHSIKVPVPLFLTAVPFLLAASLFSFFCRGETVWPKWVVFFARGSTFLYFSHFFTSRILVPLIEIVIPVDKGGGYAVLAYLVRVLAATTLSFALFFSLRRFSPRFLSVLTGNRS